MLLWALCFVSCLSLMLALRQTVKLDPLGRSELRDVLWPSFSRERKTALRTTSIVLLGIAAGPLATLTATHAALELGLVLTSAYLAAHVLAGSILWIIRRPALRHPAYETDPALRSVLLILGWPIWRLR